MSTQHTTEACDFRDAQADFQASGIQILGISPDPVPSLAKFVAKHRLSVPLLADPTNAVCRSFGVWKEKSMYGKTYMGVERTTIILDARGAVRKVYPKVKVAGHALAVLEALKSRR